jgi:hypothetical protein
VIYYVVGFSDTRREFQPKGVTRSLTKAEKYQEQLVKELFINSRQWVSIKEVNGI